MDGPKSTTRLTARQNRTPTGKSSPWISANFFISFVFISPGIFYSYKFIQHKHWQFSCKWACCNGDRYFSKIVTAVVCKTLKNLWPTSLVLGGLLLFFELVNELSQCEKGVSSWFFQINIGLMLIDSINLFNARLFCNSVHLMILSTAKL